MTPHEGNTTKTTVNTAAIIFTKTTLHPFLRKAERALGHRTVMLKTAASCHARQEAC